jgi:peptidoglycan/LPS O-acetylase OafA/YrhL
MSSTRIILPERNLDVLRAAAVLCVLADHVFIAATSTNSLALGWLGRAGVLVFFVHTALVLMGSLARSSGPSPGWIARFYFRRAWRIYPLAIASIVLVLALHIPPHTPHVGMVAPFRMPDGATIYSNLLLAQNLVARPDVLGVLWTLPIEVQMYLTLPLCFLAARKSVGAVALLIVGGMIGAVAFRVGAPIPGLWRLTMLTFVPCFLAGVLAFALLRRATAPRISAGTWTLAVIALFAAFFAMRSRYESLAPQWAFCIALGLLIPLTREYRESLATRAAHLIATYSYGVYLLHLPALWIALVAFGGYPRIVQWGLFAVLMIAMPWLAYHLIERPGIWFGQRITHAPMPHATPVGAP